MINELKIDIETGFYEDLQPKMIKMIIDENMIFAKEIEKEIEEEKIF